MQANSSPTSDPHPGWLSRLVRHFFPPPAPPPPALLPPHQVRYQLAKIFAHESDEAMWPVVAGTTAKAISEKYAEDYNRCADVTRMIREDLANGRDEGRAGND